MRLEILIISNDLASESNLYDLAQCLGKDLASENIMANRMTMIGTTDLKKEVESALSRKSNLIIIGDFHSPLIDGLKELISKALDERLSIDNVSLIRNSTASEKGLKIRGKNNLIYVLPKKIGEIQFMLKNSIITDLKSIVHDN
jgi:hypothetical protein